MGERVSFGKLHATIEPPDFIEVQTRSYEAFLQKDVDPRRRKNEGLQAVFKEVFPIESYDGRYALDFVKYDLIEPKMGPLEALEEGQTYSAALHVTFRLKDGEEVREESVYMGEIPLMTASGAFVINGAERVVVSQLHRSPGVCSEQTLQANNVVLYSMRIIPDRGSWQEIQFDASDLIWIYLDRKRRRRKFLVTTFLRALGFGTDDELLRLFYTFKRLNVTTKPSRDEWKNLVFKEDMVDVDAKSVIGKKYTPVTESAWTALQRLGEKTIEVLDVSWDEGLFLNSVRADPTQDADDALKAIYQKLRPGDPVTPSNARQLLKRLFFDPRRYDLGRVGRYKINQKFDLSGKVPDDLRVLHKLKSAPTVRPLE